MVLPYEIIFSRTMGRIDDPKELSYEESDLIGIYTERLNNVVGNPTAEALGGKEEKMLLSPHKNNMTKLADMKKELNKRIRDYGYMYNSYINSES